VAARLVPHRVMHLVLVLVGQDVVGAVGAEAVVGAGNQTTLS
jgi:hypothetical protein